MCVSVSVSVCECVCVCVCVCVCEHMCMRLHGLNDKTWGSTIKESQIQSRHHRSV